MSVDTLTTFFALLTVLSNVAVVVAVVLWIGGLFSPAVAEVGARLRDSLSGSALALAWSVAAVSMAGSLYYSEIAHIPPCLLCWYQRIAMYPLAIILGIAAIKKDVGIRIYALVLAGVGTIIATYHYQLERFPDQTSIACRLDTPCSTTTIWKFHYVSFPFMAISGFLVIAVLLMIARAPQELEGDDVDDEDALLPEERG
ncbi:MAG: disulfide bond formation protein B [Actinomycetota bacterium]